MRRLRTDRVILLLCGPMFFLLTVCLCVAWARSYWVADEIRYNIPLKTRSVISSKGALGFLDAKFASITVDAGPMGLEHMIAVPENLFAPRPTSEASDGKLESREWRGFCIAHTESEDIQLDWYMVPYWAVVAPIAAILAICLVPFRKVLQSRWRIRRGCC